MVSRIVITATSGQVKHFAKLALMDINHAHDQLECIGEAEPQAKIHTIGLGTIGVLQPCAGCLVAKANI